ncbi:GntR family transcriptional regulator [Microaerobacter geothermalis]|uniref:GntR family transcriptional regulator n=1 Tax=Microaerobacter geothermalis TaxID=674972 RepID=UPI001F46AF0F|nr:GntR family transcriptional regulator [Microaerobacter geothermalis]MCF6093168.1 GntR family transcriptional regulator [Microaerobacter geothermalis]
MKLKMNNRPLYALVIDKIKKDIENGRYKEGERLPSEFQLSKELGVSRATLREALRMLEEEKMVKKRHGIGTFVSHRPVFVSGIEELISVTDTIAREKQTPGTKFLYSGIIDPGDEEKARLKLNEDEKILLVKRIRTANQIPVVYCVDRLSSRILANGFQGEQESLFEALEKSGVQIAYAVSEIIPLGYHERVSEILKCGPEISLLLLKQVHFDRENNPVLFSDNYFRADKFSFKVVRKRT